jgi:hypothetical protein
MNRFDMWSRSNLMNVGDSTDVDRPLHIYRYGMLFLLAVFTGCGGADKAAVSGTLLHQDGTPVIGARVLARSNETGKSAYGQTNASGYYELGGSEPGDGIPPGEYYVTIVEDLGDEDNRRPPTISNKYRNPATSGLSLTVMAGEHVVLDAKLDGR